MSWGSLWQPFAIAAAGGFISLVGFLFLLPKKIAEKALGHWFDSKLEAFKGEQNEKLAKLQANLDHISDRGKLSNSREYEATAMAWESYVEARFATLRAVVGFVQSPDLDRLSEGDLNEFLLSTKLTEPDVKRIRESADKNRQYARTIQLRYVNEAHKALYNARDKIMKQSVFIEKGLHDLIHTNIERLSKAQVEAQMDFGRHGGAFEAKSDLLLNDAAWLEEVRAKAREQLLRTGDRAGRT